MNEDPSIVRFRQPNEIDDPLDEPSPNQEPASCWKHAIQAEVAAFLTSMKDFKLADSRDQLVRHSHGPERMIKTGSGPSRFSRSRGQRACSSGNAKVEPFGNDP